MILERDSIGEGMKRSIGVVMGLIVTSVFIGCAGRYAFEKTEGGFYRVDKWTGETTLVVGGEANKVIMPREKEELEERLSSIREFKEATIPIDSNNNLTVSLKTIWRNGKLFYNIKCKPYNDKIIAMMNKYSPHITFLLVDKYNFSVFHHSVNLADMRRFLDNNGVEYLETSGNIIMDRTTYSLVHDVRYGRGGFTE
jgi:hypothetical protein